MFWAGATVTMSKQHYYRVPRSIKLMKELDAYEKQSDGKNSNPHANFISIGICDPLNMERQNYSIQLANWSGTIIGPQNTNLGDRIYTIKVFAGPNYPEAPPDISFVEPKIAMAEVNQSNGKVDLNAIQQHVGQRWNRTHTILDALSWVRHQMSAAARTRQPPMDSRY